MEKNEIDSLAEIVRNQQKQIELLVEAMKFNLVKQGSPAAEEISSEEEVIELDTPSVPEETETEEDLNSLFSGGGEPEETKIETELPKGKIISSSMEVEEIKESPKKVYDDFGILGGESGSSRSGKNYCTRVALSTAPRVNKFKDNKVIAKIDTIFDKKVRTRESIEAHKAIEKRQAKVKVIVECCGCNKKFRVDPELAPANYDDDESTYQCDRCILNKRG